MIPPPERVPHPTKLPPPPIDEPGFMALTEKISRERGFRCGSYKEKCLRRRIAVRMRARSVHTFADYADVLDSDVHEYERLLDALTINVTKLFRNREAYEALARTVIPALWQLPDPQIRVWSAGCSSGEEPYSVAALFHRHAESVGQLDRLARVSILGTDIDRESLLAAGRGSYEESAFDDTPAHLRRRYFSSTAPHVVAPEIRSLVRFERRDLLLELPPSGGHHLIVCRNVIIYFDRPTQETLFQHFHAALLSGGFLMLGKVETLLGTARTLFTPAEQRERIFRRP